MTCVIYQIGAGRTGFESLRDWARKQARCKRQGDQFGQRDADGPGTTNPLRCWLSGWSAQRESFERELKVDL
jgi:hypothetical protein